MGGKGSGRPVNVENIFKREIRSGEPTNHNLIIPNHSGDHSAGIVRSTPVNDYDIANKAYVDAQAGGASELSDLSDVTLTTLGDNEILLSSSGIFINQTLAEAGISATGHAHATTDITSGTFADARISESSVTQHEAAINHDALNNFVANEHIDWTSTTSNFSTSGTAGTGALTFTTATGTGDNSSADTAYVPMVLYNTDATPPTASNFPQGTIYLQHAA